MTFLLSTPVSQLNRVGNATANRLKKLGIETVNDLIFYYPFRWQDLTAVTTIGQIKAGEQATVKGRIQLIANRRSPRKRMLLTEAVVSDESGAIKVVWFNQPYLTKTLKSGDEIFLSGKTDSDRYASQLINPVYEKLSAHDPTHLARIVPLYSLTDGLTQKQLRFLIRGILPSIQLVAEWLPEHILIEHHLLGIQRALTQIHFPDSNQSLAQAERRLKFNELLLFQAQVQLNRAELSTNNAPPLRFYEPETRDFVSRLPFTLTDDQRRAAWTIINDMGRPRPMARLLEGEVGSGKTVVATIAMFNAALNGYQTVLIAPTEILAGQHYQTISNLLQHTKLAIGLLTGSQQICNGVAVTRKQLVDSLRRGSLSVLVGTHALLEADVAFYHLGLAIIDEQHRFGVNQRATLLRESGTEKQLPHLLTMTATPIPRSLALTLYADLDMSVIRQLPKERKKIVTEIVTAGNRQQVYHLIRKEIEQGHQAFVICPLIDPSDRLGVKSVTEEYEKLKHNEFAGLAISFLHGKMKPAKKEGVMADFLARKFDILVSTSVIEVGVDVPNATVMLIEGAERFGLAQLHQFRGRVGRSSFQSYCYLAPQTVNEKVMARLTAVVAAKDGFELAERDLALRGPGELYGIEQSGWPAFKIASLADFDLIAEAKKTAGELLAASPNLSRFPLLYEQIASQYVQGQVLQ